MIGNFTAKYTRLPAGYMGQIVEWPEIVTEGRDLDECRAMLRDALEQMILAARDAGSEIPLGNGLFEQIAVDLDVRKTA